VASAGPAGATGCLLIQLGTPVSPSVRDVRRYLAQFLADPRVVDLPAPLRRLLLHGVILRIRPRRSAAAYRQIFGPEGSPLRVHGQALAEAVGRELGAGTRVELAMRYGEPSIATGVARLIERGAARIAVIPLFPQRAASSTGSALAELYRAAARPFDVPPLRVADPFFDHPGFLDSVAECIREAAGEWPPEHLLLSYHGLPERHVRRSGGPGCLEGPDCCEKPGARLARCYRAQCYATSRALIRLLGLPAERVTTAFQSRLGRTPWIRPYTDEVMASLAARGVRRLLVACPSFVADCLETLEEIGIRGAERWRNLGGEELRLAPCPNDRPRFASAVAEIARGLGAGGPAGAEGAGPGVREP